MAEELVEVMVLEVRMPVATVDTEGADGDGNHSGSKESGGGDGGGNGDGSDVC